MYRYRIISLCATRSHLTYNDRVLYDKTAEVPYFPAPPRYWLTWFGLGVLFLLVQLPYPLINKLGIWLGRTSMRFLKRRVSIARRNLELCFPDMDKATLERTIVGNFESLGMGLLETGMAWFWPDARSNAGLLFPA